MINLDEKLERTRITKAMSKWLSMDAPAKLLGRGLSRKEIIERVALDVGASVRAVQTALRAKLS